MTTILIADDHPIIIDGIKNILQAKKEYRIIGTARTIEDCNNMLHEMSIKGTCPNILLLDLGMPDGNSLYKLSLWKKTCPNMRTLIISCYNEASVVRMAIDMGADGYIMKESPISCLIDGIEAVMKGKTYFCKTAQKALNNTPETKQVALTFRERQVLALIVQGFPIKQIAVKLGLSFETVHSYTKYLRLKLCVNNTAALVRKAIEQKLV